MKNYPNLNISFNSCDSEPIQYIGRIQAHGYLLVIDAQDFHVLQCSNNISSLLGKPISDILNVSLLNFVEASQRALFANWLSKGFGHWINPFVLFLENQNQNKQRYNFIAHSVDKHIILEVEPTSSLDFSLQNYYQHQINQAIHHFQKVDTLRKLSGLVVNILANIMDYDHVMVFQYDEEYNGKVVAESRKDNNVNSFLEHRFPPGDIPSQAREMLLKKRSRQIADINREGVPIHPYLNPKQAKPINLLLSELRYPSEVHLEYLRNMKSEATITISIVVQNKLWGMICARHRKPYFLSYELRQYCETVVNLMASKIEQISEVSQAQELKRYLSIEGLINKQLYKTMSLPQGLLRGEHTLLDLNDATGVVLAYQGAQYHLGDTPENVAIRRLLDWLTGHQEDKVFTTRSLSKLFKSAQAYTDIASGLLSLEIAKGTQDYILWFKPEIQQEEKWGGNPHKSYDKDVLSPRKTFDSWVEKSKDYSQAWGKAEIEAAKQLRIGLLEIVQAKNYELKQINNELREALIREQELNQELTSTEEELRQTYESLNVMVRQLSQSESQLKAIYESTTDANFLLGANQEIIAYNRVAAESVKQVFGKQIRIGDDMKLYSAPTNLKEFIIHFNLAMKGQIVQVERRVEHNPDQVFWFKVSYYPVYDREGTVWAVSFNATDITKERQAQEESYRLSLVARHTDNAVIITDIEGKIEWVNEGFTRITEYTLSEVAGKAPGEVLQGPETDPLTVRQIALALTEEVGITVEILNYAKSGRKYWLRLDIQPMYNQNRELTGFMAIEMDITERIANEEELQKRERRLQSLIQSQTNFLIRLNRQGDFTFANDRFCEVFGFNDGIEKRSFTEDLTPQQQQALEGVIRACQRRTNQVSKLTLRQRSRLIEWEFMGVHNLQGELLEIQGMGLDITEKYENERQLIESESKYRLLADNVQDLICLHNLNFELTYISPAVTTLLGYQENDYLYRKPWRLIHPTDLRIINLLNKQNAKKNKKHQTWTFEYRIRHKNGKYIWFDSYIKLIKGESDEPLSYQSVSHDVTDRKEVMQKLKEREHFIRQIASTTPSVIYVIDFVIKRLIYINRTVSKILGYTRHQMIRMKDEAFNELVHPEDFEKLYTHYDKILQLSTGEIAEVSYRMRNHRGEWRWILSRNTIFIRNSNDEQFQILGTAVDITESQQTQDKIRQSRAQLKNIIESTDLSIFSFDQDLKVVNYNQLFANNFKTYLADDIVKGDNLISKLPEKAQDKVRKVAKLTLQGKSQKLIESFLNPISQQFTYFEFIINPTKVNLEITGVVVVVKDITQEREIQENLKLAKERAEEVSRLKSNFLANMSHEIRTPINGILGLAQVIEEEEDLKEIREYIMLQKQSGKRLLSTITSILNLSRLEGNQTIDSFKILEVNSIIKEIANTLRHLAEQKNLEIELRLSETPLSCLADESMLHQILNNIIGNAIKFTNQGKVILSSCKQGEMLVLKIRDTGVGIDEEFLSEIFEPFTQESTGYSRNFEGSGLGLSISKRYIELLEGTIKVTSQKGKGSEFVITLPLTQTD